MSRLSEVLKEAEKESNFLFDAKVIKYFLNDPFPKNLDDLEPDTDRDHFIQEVLKLATIAANFIEGGRANKEGVTVKDITEEQFALGREVEYEHTYGKDEVAQFIATRIMLDHEAETKPAKESSYYYMNANGTPEVRGEK